MTFDSIKKNGGVVHGLGHGASAALMQDGNLDVTSGCGAVMPSFIELHEKPGIRLLAVDPDIAEKACADPKLRGMFPIKIPKGVYKGTDEVFSVGILEVFVVKEDMTDDLAYELTKILYESQSLKDLYKENTFLRDLQRFM